MSLHSMFATDPAIEVEGVFCVYDDTRFLIARSGGANHEFRKVFKALTKPYERQIQNNTLPEAKGQNLLAEAYSKAVIRRVDTHKLDKDGAPVYDDNHEPVWDTNKYKDEEGKSHKSSPKLIKSLLLKYPDLFADLQYMSRQAGNFQNDLDDADEGNSGPS